MALQVTLTDSETGATYVAAYVRVPAADIELDFVKQKARFKALAYFSTSAAAAGKQRVIERIFTLEGPEFVQVFGTPAVNRAYAFLKTLPLFADAVDV